MGEKNKVIIIGAGPAGLTMAHELLKGENNKKYDVTLYRLWEDFLKTKE